MRHDCLILALVTAGSLIGCGGSSDVTVARRDSVPLRTASAARPAPSMAVDHSAPHKDTASEVVAASPLQVHDRYIGVHEILSGASAELAKLPKDISEAAFQVRAAEILRRQTRERISSILLLVEAGRRLGEHEKRYIDAQVKQIREKMISEIGGGSSHKLKTELEREGVDIEELAKEQRQRLTVSLYLRSRITPYIHVNRPILWKYYNEHLQEFATDKKVRMQLIAVPFGCLLPVRTIRPSDRETQAAKAKAATLIAEAQKALEDGEDFGKLAGRLAEQIKSVRGADWATGRPVGKIYVERMSASAGMWEVMAADNFREAEVEAAAFELEEGQISDVISTSTGHYVVKAAEVYPGKVLPFEDAQEKIERRIRNAEYEKQANARFAKLLLDFEQLQGPGYEARVENLLAMAVETAVARFRRR